MGAVLRITESRVTYSVVVITTTDSTLSHPSWMTVAGVARAFSAAAAAAAAAAAY
jgi:hypothetical protein